MKGEMISRIKELYENNGNIMKYLREFENRNYNSSEDIMISYDFQTGTYNKHYMDNRELYHQYHSEISKYINYYISKLSSKKYKILEAGVGEGTTFGPVVGQLDVQPECSYGFDISWSRVKECERFLDMLRFCGKKYIFLGDIFSMPFRDNSIEIVYTVHALEPNGGKEKELLEELYRVTGKYLILFEPSYEFGDMEQKRRMEYHGYVKDLSGKARELGYNIIEHRLLETSLNEKNVTALLVICKDTDMEKGDALCDPLTKGDLILGKSSYFALESLLAYPIVEGVPCLNIENGILATKYCR